MDSATIKGVVERLTGKGLVTSRPDDSDQRLRIVELTADGQAAFEIALPQALIARAETIAPITEEEAAAFEAILAKLVG